MIRLCVYVLALFSLVDMWAVTGGDAPNTVVIRGRPRETREAARSPGRSLVVTPKDPSRFDFLAHMKVQSSLQALETSSMKPSGFVVPGVRGQDPKATEVYIEGMLLQDPYLGMPAIQDLDLRALGQMQIHYGLNPVDLPGVHSGGSLVYRFMPSRTSYTGMQWGEPYGKSLWGTASWQDKRWWGRLYGRTHHTHGRYTYYSDEGTPYQPADDRLRVRVNNDQRSQQYLPFMRVALGERWGHIQGFAVVGQWERGIPPGLQPAPPGPPLRTEGRSTLGQCLWTFSPIQKGEGTTDSPLKASVGVAWDLERRLTRGGGQQVYRQTQSASKKASLGLEAHPFSWASFYGYSEGGAVEVQFPGLGGGGFGDKEPAALIRRTTLNSLGAEWTPGAGVSVEVKASHRTAQSPPHALGADAWGIGCGFLGRGMRTYMQISRHKRLPSLWEEFGDGVTIQPHDTDDLRPETTDHREIGWNPPAYHQLHMGISAYQDRVQDKIMLVPVSLGSFKTQNVKSSYIRGIDVSVHWRQDSLGLTYTRLWPQNLLPDLSPPTITQLVGIPEHTWTGFMGYTWKDTLTLRWLSRYRSLVFRDQENTVCLPGTHKHDVNLDITLLHGWRLGFEIRNLWNVLWVPIDAPPLSRGKTAYSDVAGAPLPGRQWMMSMDKAW